MTRMALLFVSMLIVSLETNRTWPVVHRRLSAPEQQEGWTTTSSLTTDEAWIRKDILQTLACHATDTKTMQLQPLRSLFCQEANNTDATTTPSPGLLSLWSEATLLMSHNVLERVVAMASQHSATLLSKHKVSLWAPQGDIGLNVVLKELSGNNRIADYRLHSLNTVLGQGKLFVDAGSNLGVVSLLILLEYPETNVISVEAAAPTWFMQQLNMRLNLPRTVFQNNVRIVQAGLGSTDGGTFPMMWRPSSTTSTRAWTPKREHRPESDIELQVPMRTLRSIVGNNINSIDLLKVDCEGCEYNVLPSMTEEEFGMVKNAIGELHWGYIPDSKKPSSSRAAMTHKRLCKFQNFASQAKECCAFPELAVEHTNATVRDIAGSLCDGFDTWAQHNKLNTIPDDRKWFDTGSSMA